MSNINQQFSVEIFNFTTMSSMLLRTLPTRPAYPVVLRASRGLAHSSRQMLHQGEEWKHFPFQDPSDPRNTRAFTVKFVGILGFAFGLPFVATWWLWHRPGGLKNPDGQWPKWAQ